LQELFINEYFINYDNMKSKFGSLIFVVAIAIVAAWNFSRNQNEIVLADLALENVEALAGGEGPAHVGCKSSSIWCYYSNGWTYGEYYYKP
jgi:hypothetical protein